MVKKMLGLVPRTLKDQKVVPIIRPQSRLELTPNSKSVYLRREKIINNI